MSKKAVLLVMNSEKTAALLEFLSEVRRRFPQTPVAVRTSFPTPKVVAEAFEQGEFDLLMAPYTEQEVRDAVEAALNKALMTARPPGVS